ncbi:MAG: Hpt domain-containing protein [Treponema sp.]|uniref:Hpt domain-containing protein n=1 Tax=Treponema sp. TaxID=166 RepID=UPI00298D7FF1|nr:Hpt domain-containing protein [Treponema sp.]MCR5386477.1 Hpt domain-containing protein [Treponema sp.]
MTIRECYEKCGEDFNEVYERLLSEDRIIRFAIKFFETPEFSELEKALEEKNADAAFRAAHTLKGNALSMGFLVLAQKISDIVELLRPRPSVEPGLDEALALFKDFKTEYERIKDIFQELQ